MNAAARIPTSQYMFLENISWDTYESLLRAAGERHVRMTYDDGDLEVMTLSLGHERFGELLASFVLILAMELSLPFASGGSTTLRRRIKRKGLEPDKCFWFQHERQMRAKTKWKAAQDPPPDLALEIEISRSALNRMKIYAALKVPEVWRCNRKMLRVYRLNQEGSYRSQGESGLFPFLSMAELHKFIKSEEDQLTVLKRFTDWVRAEVLPRYQAWRQRSKKNGK
jgi:Uma2 family endonuclease